MRIVSLYDSGFALHDGRADDQHPDPDRKDERGHCAADRGDLAQNFGGVAVADSGQERELEDDLAVPDVLEREQGASAEGEFFEPAELRGPADGLSVAGVFYGAADESGSDCGGEGSGETSHFVFLSWKRCLVIRQLGSDVACRIRDRMLLHPLQLLRAAAGFLICYTISRVI